MIVSRKCSFESAHFLPNYPGKCASIHGHRFVVEIGVEGDIKGDGMVVDFTILKGWMNQNIVEVFDHKLINDIIIIPTAENIAEFIVGNFQRTFTLNLAFVRVWETPDSMVEWRPNDR